MAAFLRGVSHHRGRSTKRTAPVIRPVFRRPDSGSRLVGPNCPLESLTEGEAGETG